MNPRLAILFIDSWILEAGWKGSLKREESSLIILKKKEGKKKYKSPKSLFYSVRQLKDPSFTGIHGKRVQQFRRGVKSREMELTRSCVVKDSEGYTEPKSNYGARGLVDFHISPGHLRDLSTIVAKRGD